MVGELLERGLADVVHVAPAWRSPFKDGTGASPHHRLAMLRLAFADLDGVTIEDLEVVRGGASFTVDTLRALRVQHPDAKWRLVLGADAASGLADWREVGKVLDMADLIIFPRDGRQPNLAIFGTAATVVEGFADEVSSTDIRTVLEAGEVPEARLSAGVVNYIRRHRLYGLGESGGPACP